MNKAQPRQRLAAILAADAVGYSLRMAEDDRATLSALDTARAVFRTHVESQGGRVVDTAGDSVLASFETATGAALAAIAIQKKLSSPPRALRGAPRLSFRIGVHLGDVLEKNDGTLYGDGVNVAARLQSLCEPGGVMISQAVHAAATSRLRSRFEDAGEQMAKNLVRPVHVFRMRPDLRADPAPPPAVAVLEGVPPHSRPFAPPGERPPLVGREADLAALNELLAQHRCVTVLGAGGIGKTSLALAAAHARQQAHPAGAAWVDLSSISQASLMCGLVARALHLPVARADHALPALIAGLERLHLLLVLDNAEHLVDDVARLAVAVLAGAPGVHLLVTSQVALKVEHEHLFRLGPLAVPEVGCVAVDAVNYGAVALFVAQAQAADQRFQLTDKNVATVVGLCRHLDGLALAIKLAARRVPMFGLQGLEQGLAERLQLVAGTIRGAPSRQQTLRAALDWSYGLLGTEEQATFRQLGVFAGACGFNLELVRDLADGAGADAWVVTEHVATMLDRSLVVHDGADPPRYRLLESAREYALHQLVERHELAAAHEHFAHAMLALLGRFNAARFAPAMPDVALIREFGPEIDNIRLAIAWCVQHDPALATELVGASAFLFMFLNLKEEHRRYAEAVEPAVASATQVVAASYWLARALHETSIAFPSVQAGERALSLFRTLGDERGVAFSLCLLGLTQIYTPAQWSAARAELEALAPAVWQSGRMRGTRLQAEAAMNLRHERFAEALTAAEAGLAFSRANGHLNNVALFTRWALLAELALGRLDAALRRAREQIAAERLWRGSVLEITPGSLAEVLARQGRCAECRVALADFFDASRRCGWSGFGRFGSVFVELALREKRHEHAARLLGYARTAWGSYLAQRHHGELLAALQNLLDTPRLESLLLEGRELEEEAVCGLTLETGVP